MKPKILIVDNDKDSINKVQELLKETDYEIDVLEKSTSVINRFAREDFDLVVIEIDIPDVNCIELIKELKKIKPKIQILITSKKNDIKKTVQAIKTGAFDYLEKPFKDEEVINKITKTIEKETLNYTIKKLRSKIKSLSFSDKIIGKSEVILNILKKLPVIGESDANVLITGESGTGKELFAKAIHYRSSRADKTFVPVNCSAIPHNLMESELFGHSKGAFTGAYDSKKGLFKEANFGTIFLDEIGELEPAIQVKLLRFLQEREFKPVGDTKSVKVDVRIVAATNKNLEKALEEKTFREDLYYRLNVVPIHLPPLRERKEDIPLLAAEFLKKFSTKLGKNVEGFTKAAIEKLMSYHWPGNIRELENKIEYSVIMSNNKIIDADDIVISFKKPEDKFKTFKEAKS